MIMPSIVDELYEEMIFCGDVLRIYTEDEKRLLNEFILTVQECFEDSNNRIGGIDREKFNFYVLYEPFESKNQLDREKSPLLVPAWVIFLRVLKSNPKFCEDHLKYKRYEDFERAYHEKFGVITAEESHRLWDTANWMNIFVKMVPARRSKCLALKVVPKVVEDYSINYVQGSGQTIATNHRVLIFEHESGVTPHCRKNAKRTELLDLRVSKKQRTVDPVDRNHVIQNSNKFKHLSHVHALLEISTYLFFNVDMPPAMRWALLEKTTLLSSSSPHRNLCIKMLSKLVAVCCGVNSNDHVNRAVVEKAIEEVYLLDVSARSSTKQKNAHVDSFGYSLDSARLGMSHSSNLSLDSMLSDTSDDELSKNIKEYEDSRMNTDMADGIMMLAEQANLLQPVCG